MKKMSKEMQIRELLNEYEVKKDRLRKKYERLYDEAMTANRIAELNLWVYEESKKMLNDYTKKIMEV